MNILYLHSHDTGRYIEPYGYPVPTPNLQRFAEQGVVFRQAFCTGPTCSPSRAGLLTGTYPHQCGMMGLAHRGWALKDYDWHLVNPLKRAGYHTALCGVQHVADFRKSDACKTIGYDQKLDETPGRGHAETVTAFLNQRRDADQPFFLAVGQFLTHRTGVSPDGQYWHNRDESPLGDPRYVRPPSILPDTPQTREDFADYLVAAQRLDDDYGRILNALDDAGLADDTLVLITTDHGIAFPNMKCSLTDHGTGVLMMMRGPKGTPFTGGKIVDAMVSHVDFFPTVCDVLNIDAPDRLEGNSLVPLVDGSLDPADPGALHDAVFSEVTYHAAYEPKRSVRTGRWKYIRRFDGRDVPTLPNCDNSPSKSLLLDHGWATHRLNRESLYDLTFDPNETNNLADDPGSAEVLDQMRRRLDDWMKQTDDPLLDGPVPLPEGAITTPVDAMAP